MIFVPYRADAPKLTKSMQIACQDLQLDELVVIYPGEKNYLLSEKVRVMNLMHYIKEKTLII